MNDNREVREETGLTIHNPVMIGTYRWYKCEVCWMPLEEFCTKPLAEGMLDVLEIMKTDKSECFEVTVKRESMS